jgi:hypothetical protein
MSYASTCPDGSRPIEVRRGPSMRVGTLGYFIPTLLKLLQPGRLSQKKAEDAARHWIRLNHIRSVFAFAGWLAALRALSL